MVLRSDDDLLTSRLDKRISSSSNQAGAIVRGLSMAARSSSARRLAANATPYFINSFDLSAKAASAETLAEKSGDQKNRLDWKIATTVVASTAFSAGDEVPGRT